MLEESYRPTATVTRASEHVEEEEEGVPVSGASRSRTVGSAVSISVTSLMMRNATGSDTRPSAAKCARRRSTFGIVTFTARAQS